MPDATWTMAAEIAADTTSPVERPGFCFMAVSASGRLIRVLFVAGLAAPEPFSSSA